MDYAKMLKPQKVKASASAQGNVGYDNPRENIDPAIKTKILFAVNAILTGKVGIGVGMTQPVNNLDVIGTVKMIPQVGVLGFYMDTYGSVGFGTTSLVGKFNVGGSSGEIARFADAGLYGSQNYIAIGGQRGMFGYDGVNQATVLQGVTGKGINLNVNNGVFGSGTAMVITSGGNVGINQSSPNASALLDLVSTTKGFKLMNMSTTDRDNISTPPEGLMIWNSTLHKLNVYSGTGWETVVSA